LEQHRSHGKKQHKHANTSSRGMLVNSASLRQKSVLQGLSDDSKSSVQDKSQMSELLWEETVLNFMESSTCLLFVLLIVIFTTIYAAVQLLITLDPFILSKIDLGIMLFFILELSIRMYCHARVHKEILNFIMSFLNILDIVLVSFDITMMILNNNFLQNVEGFSKTLRLCY
jgi:hypothetical protein